MKTTEKASQHLTRKINCKKTIFDIPIIRKEEIELDDLRLISFQHINYEKDKTKIVHMFLYDKIIDRIWNKPEKYVPRLQQFKAVFSPDYSAYLDMPQMYIMWNVYRNRFVGAELQNYGIKIIPTIQWAKPDTYFVCFAGVEIGSIVAISTIGALKNKETFLKGYYAMIETIKPTKVICYGEPIDGIDPDNTIFVKYKDAFSDKYL